MHIRMATMSIINFPAIPSPRDGGKRAPKESTIAKSAILSLFSMVVSDTHIV